jgi:hypothetical protein
VIKKQASIRTLKKNITSILRSPDFKPEHLKFPGSSSKLVVNALFSLLYNEDPTIKWNAVVSMGAAVSDLAEKDIEAARIVMRRLMWNLNDESGGIGWGSPEAMGEILASNSTLAREYSSILLSYIREDGNFQEHPLMQRGVLWGIGRLCESRQELFLDIAWPHVIPLLNSEDTGVRGLAVWVLGLLGADKARSPLEALRGDENHLEIYKDHAIRKYRVKDLAEEALKSLNPGG